MKESSLARKTHFADRNVCVGGGPRLRAMGIGWRWLLENTLRGMVSRLSLRNYRRTALTLSSYIAYLLDR